MIYFDKKISDQFFFKGDIIIKTNKYEKEVDLVEAKLEGRKDKSNSDEFISFTNNISESDSGFKINEIR